MQVSCRKRQKHDLVCENFFFPFLFLCQSHSQVEVPFFFFFFSSISVSDCFTLIILENFRSQGGQVPPLAPLWLRQCFFFTFTTFLFYLHLFLNPTLNSNLSSQPSHSPHKPNQGVGDQHNLNSLFSYASSLPLSLSLLQNFATGI